MSRLDDLLRVKRLVTWALPDDPPDDDGPILWPVFGGSDLATPP